MSTSTSTQYLRARESLAMFGLDGLPSNDSLLRLPPLPETPAHSRRIEDIPEGIVSAHVERIGLSPCPPATAGIREPSQKEGQDVFSSMFGHGMKRTQSYKNTLSTDYPVLSTRQSGVNPVPTRTPLRPAPCLSPTLLEGAIAQPALALTEEPITQPTSSPAEEAVTQPTYTSHPSPRRQSTSFQLPAQIGDASLIADCSWMGGAASSNGDSSVDVSIADIRPQRGLHTLPENGVSISGAQASMRSLPAIPEKQHSSLHPPTASLLNQSTLLPRSPAKSAHLLASTNAIARVEPPWTGDDSFTDPPAKTAPSPRKDLPSTAPIPRSQSSRGFPPSKRTFPASSSGQSLASVGEEHENRFNPDISTLLPVSPYKTQHLLSDHEMIAQETLFELPSFRLAGHAAQNMPPPMTSPRRSPAKMTPSRTSRATPRSTRKVADADHTLDVKDLMAKVTKPKRASGTEESFVDLLHGDDALEGMDTSMLDVSIMPLGLRPGLQTRSSPVKRPESPQSSSTSGRTMKEDSVTATRALPTSQSTRTLPVRGEETSLARSRSLSKVAEILNRVRADHLPAADSGMTASPPKTASRVRTYTTSRSSIAPAATPAISNARSSLAPRSIASSRRISLSTGNLPMAAASHKTLDLPSSRPYHSRATSTQAAVPSVLDRSARPSVAPTATIARSSRLGSVTITAAATARPAGSTRLPTQTSVAAAATTSTAATTGTSGASSRLARPSAFRPTGLPQPGTGPSARSAPVSSAAASSSRLSRGFGTDASTTTNRLPRAANMVTKPVTGTKLSIGPGVSPSKRITEPLTTKSRALSTPATAMATSRLSTLPPAATRTARPPIQLVKKTSVTLPTSSASSRLTASGLPRARTEATGPVRSTAVAPSRLPAPNQGLSALRTRLDQLQAKQRVGR